MALNGNHVPGAGDHVGDHNLIDAELARLSGLFNGLIVMLPAPLGNGSDDTAAINAVLTASTGKVVRGRAGSTYTILSALRIPSHTELDMRGCTVIQPASGVASGGSNLLNNVSVVPHRAVNDGAISASSTTLTSATAGFTSSDVGRSVYVPGAAVSGDLLVSTITAVTNATTVTLAAAASTTVSGAALSIFNRDRNITIRGGRWEKHSSAGGGTVQTQVIRLRHVDGWRIIDTEHHSTAGKYAIGIADCTKGKINGQVYDNAHSDGVHIAGPARDIYVGNQSGTTGDDMVAITTQEPTGFTGYNDCLGPVSDVVFENISPTNGGSRAVLLASGRSGSLKRVKVDGVSGNVVAQPGIIIGTGAAADITDAQDISIRNITVQVPADKNLIYSSSNIVNLTVDNASIQEAAKSYMGIRFNGGTVTNAVLNDIKSTGAAANGHLVYIEGATAVTGLTINGVRASGITTATHLVYVTATASINGLTLRDIRGTWTTTGGYVLFVASTITNITNVLLDDVRISSASGGGGLVSALTTAPALASLDLNNIRTNNVAWALGDYQQPITIHAQNVTSTNPSQGIVNARTGAQVVVSGSGLDMAQGSANGASGIAVAAGASVRFKSFDLKTDVSKLTKTAGDFAFNSNAGLACGVGPVVTDGTNWKGLFSGATA